MSQLTVNHNWAADQWDWPLQNADGVVKVTYCAFLTFFVFF